MTYAVQTDMIERFGTEAIEALTDHENSGQIDAQALGLALADADAEIDAILVKRYDVPIADPPPHLVRVACDLSRFNLYDHDVPEAVTNLRESALAWLREVAAGRADLPGVSDKSGAETAGSPEFVCEGRVFSRDTLKDF